MFALYTQCLYTQFLFWKVLYGWFLRLFVYHYIYLYTSIFVSETMLSSIFVQSDCSFAAIILMVNKQVNKLADLPGKGFL